MMKVITKEDYWGWLSEIAFPIELPSARLAARAARYWQRRVAARELRYGLKAVEDLYILNRLQDCKGLRILEAGGGDSRILRRLARANECWLVDKFEGLGNGPDYAPRMRGVRVVRDYMGAMNAGIPDGAFDVVFSISVIEHIELDALEAFFRDCARVLKPGGRMYHAIDTYVFDPQDRDLGAARFFRERLRAYLRFADRPDLGLRLTSAPSIDENLGFSCTYAANIDYNMFLINHVRPDPKRWRGQLVGIQTEWVKDTAPHAGTVDGRP